MSKNKIVITSIFPPTVAVEAFAKNASAGLIVVGDKKSPATWHCENVQYLSVEDQQGMAFELASVLPFNHYSRKMMGYLKAISEGAKYIIDTDDDNIPKDDWTFPAFEGTFQRLDEPTGFINIYQLFTKQKIWPRGLPLNLISKDFALETHISSGECKIGIWQGLADEDPDVDAIYRLTSDEPCYFDDRDPVVLGNAVVSPFNTQNTMIRKELFCLLYLPTYVTFRFTDILRSLIAQPVMWLHGYELGFVKATVVQKRNPHDYMKDFISEIPMYEHGEKVIQIVSDAISKTQPIEKNLLDAYGALLAAGIVTEKELVTLQAWLNDLDNIHGK